MNAIILLHEIYGKNRFIDEQKDIFSSLGDVYCPDFYNGRVFGYSDDKEAYNYYYGIDDNYKISTVHSLCKKLKSEYEKVFIIGFSAGGKLAWRFSENPYCDGIVACYGSQIRNNLGIKSKCPSLLILAEQDSFDVQSLIYSLSDTPNTSIKTFPCSHGFIDRYSSSYDEKQAEAAVRIIYDFIKSI